MGEISKYFFTLRSSNSDTPGPNEPKVLGTTTFTPEHVCEISFRLLNIFEKLWQEERIALDREEEKKQKRKTKKVRIIFWRAMFGVKYLENPWR